MNKRQFIRVVPKKPVKIDINGDNFIDVVTIKDISMGGVGISVKHKFEGCLIDNSVKLIVTLDEKTSFTTYAKIKYVTGNFFGVQFENLSRRSKKVLKNFIYNELKSESNFKSILFKFGFIS